MKINNKFKHVNLFDKRQDVHLQREHNPQLFRYDVAEKLLPENGKTKLVLELGGGTGEFSRRLFERGFDVTFVDLNMNNIKKVKNDLGIEGYCFNLNEGLRIFNNQQFDGIVILDVIEHIVNAEFLLQEMNRVLKKEGFMILSTPNFSFFINRFRILFGKLTIDEGYHYRWFNKKVLNKRLKKFGFMIEKYYNYSPAIGINFFWNKLLKQKRLHIHIPPFISSFFSQTLVVRAKKIEEF